MLKKYRNNLLQAIIDLEFDPTLFSSSEENGRFRIDLRNTPLWFEVGNTYDDYHALDCQFVKFGPGYPGSGFLPADGFTSIDRVLLYLRHWLDEHVREYLDELELPDLWEQVNAQHSLISGQAPDTYDQSYFSEEEKDQIHHSLEVFRERLITAFSPDDHQMAAIDARLQYLTQAVDRLNRFDWMSVAISTLISISVALSLDTDRDLTP